MGKRLANALFWPNISTLHCLPYVPSAIRKEIKLKSLMSLKDSSYTEDRITDSYRSEKTSRGPLVQPPAQRTSSRLLKAMSTLFLNISGDAGSTASLGSLLPCFTSLMAFFFLK